MAAPAWRGLGHGTRAAARRLRILLVEDHQPAAEVLSKMLTRMGHLVVTAGTIGEGLAGVRAEEFDLLISDLGLPDGSGHGLMRQVHELKPQLRALALSGYDHELYLEKSREAGFVEHLTKPVDLQSLEAAMARVMGANA